MVHKKYIKIGGRTYGPYYYKSYREGGKIKKKYIKINKELRRVKSEKNIVLLKPLVIFYFGIVFLLLAVTVIWYVLPFSVFEAVFPGVFLSPPGASSIVIGDANLTIWDDSDFGLIRISGSNVGFFGNFTQHSTETPIDGTNGNCSIRYNFDGSFTGYDNVSYNSSSLLWEVNKVFNYKGNHIFEVNCSSGFGSPVLTNNFLIDNSAPQILLNLGGSFINVDGMVDTPDVLSCVEDILCSYNFSANVSDVDFNDALTFDYIPGPNSTLTNFVIEPLTGILDIDIINDIDTGSKRIELTAVDNDNARETGILLVNIAPVNDPPAFSNLENKSFNRTMLFEYYISADDEEDNVPFSFNISFVSCNLAQWSTRTDCELFNTSQYVINDTNYILNNVSNVGGSINISFIPSRNDVGSYVINFTVSDLNNNIAPYNATTSVIVNFTVLNINEAPYFRYVCDNERVAVENLPFGCYINASDIDEINNLTFLSNQGWFLNSKTVSVNVTTNFNGSVLVNFTATDREVGNWSINVSVRDTGSPIGINSSVFYFFVNNVNDSVALHGLQSVNAYTSNNYTLYANASDDDLLIPDKNVYNEIISFSSNESWVSINSLGVIGGTNITRAEIRFSPLNAPGGAGIYRINITARDANGYSADSKVLVINISGNFAPQWQNPPITNILTENVSFYLNLSEEVIDADGDSISFSFISDTSFPLFNLNFSTGVINFTPEDRDVGQHIVIVNASDGKTPSPFTFNFTVINVNDNPIIERPLIVENATIDLNSNVNATEDSLTSISFFVIDDDFKIPAGQKDFYDERLFVNLTINGRNETLFEFSRDPTFPDPSNPNRALFTSIFIPRKSDIGLYNITIKSSDFSNSSDFILFNLSVNEIQHAPVLMSLSDQVTSINRSIFYDINATDIEDGDDSMGNLTFSYAFLPDGRTNDFINGDERIFNTTYGVLNATFGDTQGGAYHINITVADSIGLEDHGDFWLYVYDLPRIIFPNANFVFNLTEGRTRNLTFIANSTGIGNLTYRFFINDNLKFNTSYYGNGTPFIWQFTPGFSDETYGTFGNLSLVVSIPGFDYLNASMIWNTNISHSNAPLVFIKNIGDKQASVGQQININLSEHFSDPDAFDPNYNQPVNFVVYSNKNVNGSASAIGYSVSSDWILTLTSGSVVIEILNISGSDLGSNGSILTNATSNNFEVKFTEPITIEVPVPVPVPTAGGGGGGSGEKPVSLKIILPGPVSVKRGEAIILPISLVNDGSVALNDISLDSLTAKDGLLREDINTYFDRDFISSLPIGGKENVTLTVEMNTTELGLYEVTVSAEVKSPDYSDWGKILINFEEGETVIDRLVFTQEFLTENPECLELNELVDESRQYLAEGDFESAEIKLTEAVNGCKDVISQQSLFSKKRFSYKVQDSVFLYLLITTIIAIVLGVSYYIYKSISIKRRLEEAINSGSESELVKF